MGSAARRRRSSIDVVDRQRCHAPRLRSKLQPVKAPGASGRRIADSAVLEEGGGRRQRVEDRVVRKSIGLVRDQPDVAMTVFRSARDRHGAVHIPGRELAQVVFAGKDLPAKNALQTGARVSSGDVHTVVVAPLIRPMHRDPACNVLACQSAMDGDRGWSDLVEPDQANPGHRVAADRRHVEAGGIHGRIASGWTR